MNTKERLRNLLYEHIGSYLSGEEIAEQLSVSRTSIWKAVNALRREGYEIDAVQHKGYRLAATVDVLSKEGLTAYLGDEADAFCIELYPEVTSTNTLIRDRANDGAKEGLVILANMQTQGRGRFGRTFFSPSDSGIYMSLLLRPTEMTHPEATRITTMAAVAVCEAIESVSQKQAGIKWVNDIYMNEKKVCGILTEASVSMEDGSLSYVILGIGVNAYAPKEGFPEDIENKAGAVFYERKKDAKNRLVAEILKKFLYYYKAKDTTEYTKTYREKSIVIGKQIKVMSFSDEKNALVSDIDDACRLLVRYEDGTEESLSSGEISIRW